MFGGELVEGISSGCTMAPHTSYTPVGGIEYEEPVSRTYQYRKVMKPMLERKRRARINRCLDELKDLMVTALQAEGENVAKLEKADILELTVRHLHTLRAARRLTLTPENSYADRFRDGFTQCAQEVSSFLSTPVAATVHPAAGAQLMRHLGGCLRRFEGPASDSLGNTEISATTINSNSKASLVSPMTNVMVNVPQNVYTPPQSPVSMMSSSGEYSETSNSVWRPW
ncbi:enhancer of split mbeta protein [Ptiloglossa arizonensis]|uniref:enhancer of split mbeta protein n=1 Tax=Ptiloglossa arizonensis TaxID=3350558 RepID=UPI003F9F3A84